MKISQQTKKRGSKKSAKKNEKRDNRIFGRSMQGRLALTFGVVTVALFALSIVLIRINAGKGEQYSKTVLSQQDYSSTVVPFRRGMITDRNQTVLATSERVYNLILDPKVILTNDGVNSAITMTGRSWSRFWQIRRRVPMCGIRGSFPRKNMSFF